MHKCNKMVLLPRRWALELESDLDYRVLNLNRSNWGKKTTCLWHYMTEIYCGNWKFLPKSFHVRQNNILRDIICHVFPFYLAVKSINCKAFSHTLRIQNVWLWCRFCGNTEKNWLRFLCVYVSVLQLLSMFGVSSALAVRFIANIEYNRGPLGRISRLHVKINFSHRPEYLL